MAAFAENVPENAAELVRLVYDANLFGAGDEGLGAIAGHGDAGKVALDVGGEDADPGLAKTFRQLLQRHRLAGPGRAGDEAMAIGVTQQQVIVSIALADENFSGNFLRVFGHGGNRSFCLIMAQDNARGRFWRVIRASPARRSEIIWRNVPCTGRA